MTDPDPIAMKYLLSELRAFDKELRRSAVMKLGMQGGDVAIRALMDVVQNQYEDLIVRGRAAQMLGMLGDVRAVDPLIRALNNPGYQAQLSAVEALGKLGSARAIAPLLEVANDKSRDKVRAAAWHSLGLLGWEREVTDKQVAPEDDASPVLEEI